MAPTSKDKRTAITKVLAHSAEEEEESSSDEELPFAVLGLTRSPEHDDMDDMDEEHEEDDTEEELEDEEEMGGGAEAAAVADKDEDDAEVQEGQIVNVPKKRKAGSKSREKRKAARVEEAIEEDAMKISFTITAFSTDELKKPASRRVGRSTLTDVSSALPWVDAMAHFKIAISDLLFPGKATVSDDSFELAWSIPRIAPGPFSLNKEAHYSQLVNKVSKKNPAARIIVNEIQDQNKENIPETLVQVLNQIPAPAKEKPKAKAKSKIRKEADILPGNQALNDNIKSIREHWQCSLTTCKHEYCYIPPDGLHFPLSHDHCSKWAAAILKGPTVATLETPPNIPLFDSSPANSNHAASVVVTTSPILRARMAEKEKREGPQQLAPPLLQAPPIHIYNYQHPLQGNLGPAAAIGSAPPTYLAPAMLGTSMRMDLSTFCAAFNVPEEIQNRLQAHRITGTHAFEHLTPDDLKEMGFKVGEIIDLKEAIREWACAANDSAFSSSSSYAT